MFVLLITMQRIYFKWKCVTKINENQMYLTKVFLYLLYCCCVFMNIILQYLTLLSHAEDSHLWPCLSSFKKALNIESIWHEPELGARKVTDICCMVKRNKILAWMYWNFGNATFPFCFFPWALCMFYINIKLKTMHYLKAETLNIHVMNLFLWFIQWPKIGRLLRGLSLQKNVV